MAALFLGLGATSMLLQVLTSSMRETLLAEDVAQLRAIGDVQANLATSHLWMEEYVTGDPGSRAEIWSGLATSRTLVRAMLKGGELASTQQTIRAVSDPALRRNLHTFAAHIDRFAAISATRAAGYRNGEDVAPGSPADARYDAAFRELIARALALRAEIEQRVTASVQRTRAYSNAILAGWGLMVALALLGFVLIERRRAIAEAALLRSELNFAQAQKMDAVGRLAGGLAHDINNYLAAIVAQCELVARRASALDDTEAVAAVRGRMQVVTDIAARAAGLIQRLLAFSRPQAPHVEVVALQRVVEGLLNMLRQIMGSTVEVATSFDAATGNVRIDPTQLEQIIVNLAVNAREAMPDGGLLKISTRREQFAVVAGEATGAGPYQVLQVTDTGSGIAPEIRDRIFEPFFTTRTESSNNGLGLATVYALARQNLGFVRLRSSLGGGTTFEVCLPESLEMVSLVSPVNAQSPQSPVEAPAWATSGVEVLLVDDNAELREPLVAQLQSMGHRVVIAASGEEAIELSGRHGGPDLV
ncbi:MAG: ATP-binding protein, partial [Lysobacterales bacterium]